MTVTTLYIMPGQVGRPKKQGEVYDHPHVVKFTASEMKGLEGRRKKSGISISEQIRRAVRAYLGLNKTHDTPADGALTEEVRTAIAQAVASQNEAGLRIKLTPSHWTAVTRIANAMGYDDASRFAEHLILSTAGKSTSEVQRFMLGEALADVEAQVEREREARRGGERKAA